MRKLFRNYSVQTKSKLVKDEPDGSTTTILDEDAMMAGPEIAAAYSEVAKDFITHAAVVITGAFCLCKIVERICK